MSVQKCPCMKLTVIKPAHKQAIDDLWCWYEQLYAVSQRASQPMLAAGWCAALQESKRD